MFGRILTVLAVMATAAAQAAAPGDLRPFLRDGLTQASLPPGPQSDALRALYESRNFEPLWFAADGSSARALRLTELLRDAPALGLLPADYKIADLDRLRRAADARGLAEVELGLSRAAARFAADLAGGRVASVTLPADIRIAPRAVDLAGVLRELARADDPARVFDALAPRDPAYVELLAALAELRAIKARGGWRNVDPRGGTLEPDAADPRVPALRRRLAVTDGAMAEPPDAVNPEHYDPALAEAVKRFQRRHGLVVDGRVGPRSFAALNRTVDQRIAQVSVNLDRIRAQAPRGPAFIEVNVPAFELRAFENGEVKLEMDVIVGRARRATPIFSTRVTEIIFNPPWTVPAKLVREDMLPRLRVNPQALADQGFKVFRGWGEERVEIDPRQVDWRKVSPRAMPYTMRQEPGPKNALGQVRFTMPNTFDVFMHDTPDRHYFRRTDRALSSGCVRVERPIDLVEWVLRNTPHWNREAIDAADAEDRTRHVPVHGGQPQVHLVYNTAFVENGVLQLRDDIYGLDALFVAGIEKRPLASLTLPAEGAPAPVTLSP
jgi:murein L,D-transpeptidase YcbB/YkuD